jgi:hypothetical protein
MCEKGLRHCIKRGRNDETMRHNTDACTGNYIGSYILGIRALHTCI